MTKKKSPKTRKSGSASKTGRKSSNPPRSRAVVRGANPVSRVAAVPRRIISAVCAITDPFCVAAVGAKYPDSSSLRSLPWTLHGRTVLPTTATGNGAILFAPNYVNQPFVLHTSGTAPVYAFNAFTDAASERIAGVNSFRLVSWGLRISCVAAPLSASGMVHIRGLTNQEGNNMSVIDCVSYARSESLSIPLQDCKDIHVVGARTAQPPATWYPPGLVGSSALVSTWIAPGFSPVTIFVSGGPATVTVLDIEYLFHYELQFDDTSDLGLLSTPAPPYNALVVSASSAATATAKHFLTQGALAVGKFLERRAMTAIAGMVGGPGAAAGITAGMLALEVN